MKSTWFADRRRYEIARLIAEADYHSHSWTTFGAFLDAACGALRQGVYKLRTGSLSDDIESGVVRAQRSVRHPEKLGQAFAVLVEALEAEPADVLGSLMSEWSMNDRKWKGQCFTPKPISEFMARVGMRDLEPDDSRTLRLCEPACGGGSMIIAASQVLKEQGFYPWHYQWTAIDIDRRCFQMTYIQSTLLGIPAGVIHGNALSVEHWDSAWTLAAVLHPERPRRRPAAQQPAKAETVPLESVVLNQLTMF